MVTWIIAALCATGVETDQAKIQEARLDSMRNLLETWRTKMEDKRDVRYALETTLYPEAASTDPVYKAIEHEVRSVLNIRDVRRAGEFVHEGRGETISLVSGTSHPHTCARSFDGEIAMAERQHDVRILASPDERTHYSPVILVGLDLLGQLLAGKALSISEFVTQTTLVDLDEQKCRLAFVAENEHEGKEILLRYVFELDRSTPNVIHSFAVYSGKQNSVMQRTSDLKYHRLPDGTLYPLSGTVEYFTPTGELWQEMRFEVDVANSRFNLKPDALPAETFRLDRPEK